MANTNPTVIAAHLDDKELVKSIDALVWYVEESTKDMAKSFDSSVRKMNDAMKDFAVNQKVSVSLMKDAWRDMSSAFDAMIKAQADATSGSGKGGSKVFAPNTVGELEQGINALKLQRKELELNSDELRTQNTELERRKNLLKQQTKGVATQRLESATNMSSSNLNDAEKKLRLLEILQRRYANTTELSVAQQNRLAKAIQQTKDQIDKIKPKSLRDVLGMDENSVEAIAKKMQALKRVQIDPNNAAQVKQLGMEYQRLSKLQNEMLGRNLQQIQSNNALARSFGYIRNRIAYALTLGAATSFVKQIYEIRSQYELVERSLGVLVNSFEQGSRIFQELNQMALQSPFTLIELGTAAKQLTAYNFSAKEVVDTTRRLADISAALGVPMERLTYNLGQIRAQTVLTARDARDFANAGLPIVKSLADHFSELEGRIVTTGEVYGRMSKKMVSYNDVMQVLNKMTDEGGKFFDFQAKQAETLKVQLANLSLAWNNMLNDIGSGHQQLLTMPISALKQLFKNWESINRVLGSIIWTFGIWKALQVVAIRQQWAWAAATGATAKQMGALANGFNNVKKSLIAIGSNPWTWVFVGVMAIVDLVRQTNAAKEALSELNLQIRDNAKEASESLLGFLNNKGNKEMLKLAKTNNLGSEQGEKAWEAIKEQIELSSIASNELIARLLEINDINERVKVGFDYAESIRKATVALQDLQDSTIKVTSDTGWGGIFGEGLVSDLKDYADYVAKYSEIAKKSQLSPEDTAKFLENVKVVKNAREELLSELDETAESINNFIVAHNITDPIQINEILERVKAIIKTKNPEIKGEMSRIFDIELDKKVATLTNGAIDENASLWKMFMERLKHNSSAAFQDISDDWVRSSESLSEEQQRAIDQNLEYFKSTMPYAYDAVAKMVADASKLKINIGITFNAQQLTDFQKEVNKRISSGSGIKDYGSNAFLPTNNDNLSSWVKTQQQAIKTLREENKKYERDNTQWAKIRIETNNKEIAQRQNLLDLFHQEYEEQKTSGKKSGRGGTKKDELGEAFQKEIEIITNIQKRYKEYRQAGVSAQEAITKATQEYGKTLANTNATLNRYGVTTTKSGAELAKMDLRDVRSYYTSLLEMAQKAGNVKGIEALEKAIAGLNVEIAKIDYKKITDGLNNELSKLKDEYELAVELDANPELGNMFAEMFNIDTSVLPRNIYEYVQSIQDAADKAVKDAAQLNPNALMKPFDLLRGDINKWSKETGIEIGSELAKGLVASQKQVQSSMKKYLTDIQKETRDLQYKLSDNNDKIALEEEKLRTLETKLLRETTEEKRRLLQLQIEDQKNTIAELRAVLIQEIPEYAAVFNSVIEHSAYMSKKLIADLKKIYDAAKKRGVNSNGYYTITSLVDGKETLVGKRQFEKELEKLTREERKVQSPFDKIKEAFSKDENGKIVDFAKGVELVAGEAKKAADGLRTLSEIFSALGAADETVEVMNDIANSIEGVATAAEGVTQIQSGDIIGGSINVIKGTWQAISTWFDNSNKKIDRQVQDSEKRVKRLENSYKNLENAIEQAYGMAEYGARRAAIANKQLQLVELQRQLMLEQSRDSKHRDEDRIQDLKGRIIDLRNEISQSVDDITNDLLGISSIGDAAEQLVSSMIDAFRQGEDYMKQYDESFEKMIDNMIMKAIVSRVIGDRIEQMWNQVKSVSEARGAEDRKRIEELTKQLSDAQDRATTAQSQYDKTQEGWWGKIFEDIRKSELDSANAELERIKVELAKAEKDYAKAVEPTKEDVDSMREMAAGWRDDVKNEFEYWMGAFGIGFGEGNDKQLSSLQQGITGITEDTAGAIEAYLSIVAQRVFEHGIILTEIRDAVISFDMDVQLGTMSQILLQLQASYQTQAAIQTILEGVLTPSGRAFMVELNS